MRIDVRRRSSGLQLGVKQVATVVLETGIQNVLLSLAIVNVALGASDASFTQSLAAQIYGALWMVLTTLEGIVVVLLSRWAQRRRPRAEASDACSAPASA